MKKKLRCTGIISIALLTACVGKPKELPLEWETPQPPAQERSLFFIADHKNKALGKDVPEWVYYYDAEGLQGVENLWEYRDKYIFINKNRGANFKALQQWVSNFVVSRDFARMVSSRIQNRLTAAASPYPDYTYGAFFEMAVKVSADAPYSGAVQEDDFWIKKQYFKENGTSFDQGMYDFFILVSIDRGTLRAQIDAILQDIKVAIPPTKEQELAISRIKETFYEGF